MGGFILSIGRGYTVIYFTFTAYMGGFYACIKLISFKNNKV